jgi:hypothetical protein
MRQVRICKQEESQSAGGLRPARRPPPTMHAVPRRLLAAPLVSLLLLLSVGITGALQLVDFEVSTLRVAHIHVRGGEATHTHHVHSAIPPNATRTVAALAGHGHDGECCGDCRFERDCVSPGFLPRRDPRTFAWGSANDAGSGVAGVRDEPLPTPLVLAARPPPVGVDHSQRQMQIRSVVLLL